MFGRLKDILKRGGVALGAWVTIPHPEISEILSLLGFDWLLFDLEHAPIDVGQLEPMLSSVKGKAAPLVRVPDNDPAWIKRVLDLGVAGVMVPLVSSKESAELAVKAARYPPKGIRGVGARRAALFGLREREYYEEADEEVIVIVQIETRESIKNAEAILSTEGVTAYFIGPNDLSFSLGLRSWRHPEVKEAIREVARIGKDLGVPGGMYCADEEALEFALQNDLQLLALGSDYRFLIRGAEEALGRSRSLTGR